MKQLEVKASKPYSVKIGRDLLKSCGEVMQGEHLYGKVLIVTDDRVAELYLKTVSESLIQSGFEVYSYTFPQGEKSKTFDELVKLLNFTVKCGFSRSDTLIALGGGVVGDLCGFAAAVYMRGIAYVQIPTTLLAMVDSSVGGKTAVDLPNGKNAVGAFYQPTVVLCDIDTLKTLPEEEYANGMAEVIKYGFILDGELLEKLKRNFDEEEIIARCVKIKADLVASDEFDRGERMLLNFGHTLGHAIEAKSNYTVPHGNAVAVGMVKITQICVENGRCPNKTLEQMIDLLQQYRLPTQSKYTNRELFQLTMADKKNSGESITVVLPVQTGKCELKKMSKNEWNEFLK
ncbi:MAG TPA: 3-dehydroquinate synthase [Ruminococcaceae bacterium]|nr:3-dehydroquinate synthase [Oscillospiraceae bacterium]